MLTLCWRTLTLSCPMLTLCWPKLPLSCPYVALEMLSPIAVTETTKVGRGWERGRNGQVGGWGARLYNLRLPTEGLRQGHGLRLVGRRPDLKQASACGRRPGFPSSSPTAAKPLKKAAHKIGFGLEKSCAQTICCTFISNCSKTLEGIAREARFCSLPFSSPHRIRYGWLYALC